MRIPLTTGRRTLFLALFAAAMLAFLPLRLALGWSGLDGQGFAAREVTGSLWSGRLVEARFGDIALGDLDAGLSPFALLIGRARIALASESNDPAQRLAGVVEIGRNRAAVLDASGPLSPGNAFAPLPVSALNLDGVTVRFVDGACQAAEGRVRASLAGAFLGQPLPGALSGSARCDAGALLLPLASGAGEGVNLRLWPDGRYRADLTLVPTDPVIAARLDGAGFAANGAARTFSIDGRF
ncbi:general secretion pathway protein N [Sphingomonas endophytica]|uniref:Type II secretion system protein N n=1 Tax=Sphingomonas endophytica TaxID=869719 RepID=A0A7X0JAG3_9SPHN|nr:type II secretion system protein N [Sphingomonas endophytica]MBB6503978.1 general secretion pathway protein N [Sphingomonas endophytica]